MLLSYFIPQLLATYSSSHNRDIRVLEEHGQPKLLVNGSPQSGPYIQWLWESAFRAFSFSNYKKISSVLVLGVGGGTVINILQKMYPNVLITAVDIDPVILAVAKQYFHINDRKHVVLVQADANVFVKEAAKKSKQYDLIVVDVFFGRIIPDFISSDIFLRELKRLKDKNGSICMNYLRELEYKEASDTLQQKLKIIFQTVKDYQIKNNRFFLI